MLRKSLILLTVAVVACFIVDVEGGKGATLADLAILTINDLFSSPAMLSSDGNGSYRDRRLDPGDLCVTTFARETDGSTFVWMDRNEDCGNQCNISGCTLLPRTYNLSFPTASGACSVLGLADPDGDGFCSLTVDVNHGHPRVRLSSLFQKLHPTKTSSTDSAFIFQHNGSYEVRTDSEVAIQVIDENTRQLTYTGTARLWIIALNKTGPVSESYFFPFDLVVQRVPR